MQLSIAKQYGIALAVLLVCGYAFYTGFQFAANDSSGRPLRFVRLSSGIVALGLLFVMNKRGWRVLVQLAVAIGLFVTVSVVPVLIWEQTPLVWNWMGSLFVNVLTFLAAWALWNYVLRPRRWLALTVCVVVGGVALFQPAIRSSIALTVLAVMTLSKTHGTPEDVPDTRGGE